MASKSASLFAPLARQLRPTRQPTSILLRQRPLPSPRIPISFRASHSIPRPPTGRPNPRNYEPDETPRGEGDRPEFDRAYYQLSFTCVPCGFRSHHNVSKQGYHRGSTLITCPDCRNRHVISDHLGIFGDKKQTIEDIMREKGQLVKKGSLGEDGDIEFWPDERGQSSEKP